MRGLIGHLWTDYRVNGVGGVAQRRRWGYRRMVEWSDPVLDHCQSRSHLGGDSRIVEWPDPVQQDQTNRDLPDSDEVMRPDVLCRAGSPRDAPLAVRQGQHDLRTNRVLPVPFARCHGRSLATAYPVT